MGFVSFVGRVFFASVFILAAWQEFNEFGVDGGAAARVLSPKLNALTSCVLSHTGVRVPDIEIKRLVAIAIVLKGAGGLLFIFSSTFGAYLLILHQAVYTPILYDFYNYEADRPEFGHLFMKFSQHLALFGALLFFVGMKNYVPRRQLKKKAVNSKIKTT